MLPACPISGGLNLRVFCFEPPGVPWCNTTREQLYRLGAWQHWFRAVASVNAEKAVANTALLQGVLDALSAPASTASTAPAGDSTAVTLYLGHDGNLDGLAALLGLQWEVPPWYSGNAGELVPTPPGSGLLFDLDEGANQLSVSYVYPVFVSATPAPLALNATGVLERVPVLDAAEGQPLPHLSLADFRARAMDGLRRVPGAADCFERAVRRAPPAQLAEA
jgi:hypothetical protein